MPFTLAHPAAVLPLRRLLVFSALVVGSMAPDFHYFLGLSPHDHFSHSIRGAFIFCLPVGLAVLWLFQHVLKLPLISLAPERHQEKLAGFAAAFRWGPASRFALVLLSLLVGTGTHLLWDSITHERGLVVRNFPDLRAPALEFGTERPLYNLLQHASTLLGLLVLALWYWRWFKRATPQPVPPYLRMRAGAKAWTVAAILGISGLVAVAEALVVAGNPFLRLTFFTGVAAVTFMSSTFMGAICFSLWWQWQRRRLSSNQ